MKRIGTAPLLIASFLASCLLGEAQTLVGLGNLGGNFSNAAGINDSGMVTGYSQTAGGDYHAYTYTGGTMTDSGTLGGTSSMAYGINNAGQIAGISTPSSGGSRAFISSGSGLVNLGTLPGAYYSSATGLNQSGQVVGYTFGPTHGFLSSGGTMTDLGTLGGSTSYAYAINDAGTVVGAADLASGDSHAFSYSGGIMTDLGTLGGFVSYATAINASGQIAGASFVTGYTQEHAFLYTGGIMVDLGTLGGAAAYAKGINDAGDVVGFLNGTRAFYYSQQTGMVDLNDYYSSLLVSGTDAQAGFISLNDATDINNQGQIVGTGLYWDGTSTSSMGYVLSTATPEPSTWALLAIGLILVSGKSLSPSMRSGMGSKRKS